MKKILCTVFFLSSLISVAQDFTINRVQVAGDLVNLYYDLLDSTALRTYTINLYSSRDNFVSPLEKVSGDLGLEVKPGGNRKITWNVKEEFGATFEGKVALEIRGRIYIPFVRLDGLYTSFKRSKPYEITWRGGTEQNILNFDLYRNGDKITSFPNIANVGHYTLVLPASVKPGKGYTFKISDSKNKDQIVNTAPFLIRRKVPLLIKVLPIAALGVVVATLPKTNPDTSIPEAPGPPK